MNDNCIPIRNGMGEYLEGNLDVNSNAQFQIHVKECKACKAYLQYLSSVLDRTEDLDFIPAPDLKLKIINTIQTKTLSKKNKSIKVFYHFLSTTAAILLCIFGIKLGSESAFKIQNQDRKKIIISKHFIAPLQTNELLASNPFMVYSRNKKNNSK